MPIPINPGNITEAIGFLEKGDFPGLGKLLDWKGEGGNDFSVQDLTSDQFKQLHTSIITWGGENAGKAKGLLGRLIAENEGLRKKLEVLDENTTLGQFIKANLPVGEPDSPKNKRKNEDHPDPTSTATLTPEQAEAVKRYIASLASDKIAAQAYLGKFEGPLPPLKLEGLNDERLRATLATEIQNLPEGLRTQLTGAFDKIEDQPAKKRKFISEVHSTMSTANGQLKAQIQLEATSPSPSALQPPAPQPPQSAAEKFIQAKLDPLAQKFTLIADPAANDALAVLKEILIERFPEFTEPQIAALQAFNPPELESGELPSAYYHRLAGEFNTVVSKAATVSSSEQPPAPPLSPGPPGPPSSTTSPPQPIGTEQPKLVKPNDQQLQAAIEAMKKKKEQSASQPPVPNVPPVSSTQLQPPSPSQPTGDQENLNGALESYIDNEDPEDLSAEDIDLFFLTEVDDPTELLTTQQVAELLDKIEDGKENYPNLYGVLKAFEDYHAADPKPANAGDQLKQKITEIQQAAMGQEQHQVANPQATKLTSLTSNLSQLSQQNSNDDGPKPLSFKGRGETPKTTLKGQSVVQTKEPKPPEDFKKLVDAVIKEMKLKKGDYTRSATSFEVPSKDITMQRRNDGCVCTELPNDLAKLKEVFPAILKAHQSAKMTNFELNGPKENVEFMADTCLKQKPPIKPNISKEYLEEHGYKSSEQFIQDRLKAMKGEPSAGKDKTQQVEQTSEKPKLK